MTKRTLIILTLASFFSSKLFWEENNFLIQKLFKSSRKQQVSFEQQRAQKFFFLFFFTFPKQRHHLQRIWLVKNCSIERKRRESKTQVAADILVLHRVEWVSFGNTERFYSELHKIQKCREIEYFHSFRILFLFELYTSPSSFNRSGSYIVHTRVNLFRHESIVNVFFLLVDFSYCFTFLVFPKNPSDQKPCYRSTSTSTPYVTMATVRGGHSV